LEKTNWPVASDVVVRSKPLTLSVRWTEALGITAPEGSVTAPRTAPALPLCADAETAAKARAISGRVRLSDALENEARGNVIAKSPELNNAC
jgi:hypothetical protein